MRVTHPPRTLTECPTYACTLAVEDHEPDDGLSTWHYDDTTGVHWPTGIPVLTTKNGEPSE